MTDDELPTYYDPSEFSDEIIQAIMDDERFPVQIIKRARQYEDGTIYVEKVHIDPGSSKSTLDWYLLKGRVQMTDE